MGLSRERHGVNLAAPSYRREASARLGDTRRNGASASLQRNRNGGVGNHDSVGLAMAAAATNADPAKRRDHRAVRRLPGVTPPMRLKARMNAASDS